MKHIRNFDGYRKQKQLNESYNQKVLLLHDVQLGKDDEESEGDQKDNDQKTEEVDK
jgi:hypothetical protein